MNRTRHLFRSTVIVIAFFALGKLTGLGRAWGISRVFGTGPDFDAFAAANQLPEVFVTLLAGGALAAAFIPVYSTYLTDERRRAALRLANTVLTLVLLLLATVSAIGALLAPWLAERYLVSGLPPAQQALTASLMRIILIQTTLFGVSSVLSSILNAHQHFALPALAPIALDIGYYIGLTALVPVLGIHGLAWGTVIGGVLHILIQVPALRRYRFRFRPALAIEMAGVREIAVLMGPRIVTLGSIQLADLVIFNLLSQLPQGSISGYVYGYTLQQLPETLFGTAIAIVAFPTMAELFNQGDLAALKRTAVNALGIIWTLTIPAAAAIVFLGRPALAVALQGGAFTAQSSQLVYSALLFFSVRVVSEATLEIVARLFYAQHDTATPMWTYVGWFIVHIVLANFLVGPLGIGGVALASTIAFTLQSALLYWLNWRRLGGLGGRQLAAAAARALLATGAMVAAIQLLGPLAGAGIVGLGAVTAVAGVTYLVVHLLIGGRELPALYRLLRHRAAAEGAPSDRR